MAAVRARFRPDEPSLTPQSVELLERLLRPTDVGVEWGSGNTTAWFAKRTTHLTSFESLPPYYEQVAANLRAQGLTNVDYRLFDQDFDDYEGDETAMHESPYVRGARAFGDETLDYALIDSIPRGCLCASVIPKLKPGGLLILDNANWYLPPPSSVRPAVPSSTTALMGTSGSAVPDNQCWPEMARRTADWRSCWSSNGVQMTLILIKP